MDQSYDSSSEDDCHGDPEVTLRDIEKSKTINFSIRANYTNWEPREAFRELVQNWRDGIIRSFHLREEQFIVIREEKTSGQNTEIVYKVLRFIAEDRKEWLGYIRFLSRGGEGTVEVANRSATLQPRHLDLGSTSKAGDSHQAGAHGEGLKIALLVLMRGSQNHAVRCRSGGFNWKFNFTTRGRLVARLRRMTPEAIGKEQDLAHRHIHRTLLPFVADPRNVVQFVIGERHKGRNEWGEEVKRDPVSRTEFDEWTKAALFLHDTPEGKIVSTEHGDLLTHSDLCGAIYLKGLLLGESTPGRSASITKLPLKFGYNFARGKTNRERQSVASADEESRAILAIWNRAVHVKPAMARDLSGMLNSAEVDYADIYGAKRRMGLETASALRRYLLDEEGAGKWYYCAEDESKNPRLDHIIQGLGREPCELTKTYWDIMRRHKLLRTAEEEERLLFTAAPPVALPGTPFSESVHRLFRACARACPRMYGISICFVAAGSLHLQLFFSEAERLFRIHERWLSPEGARSELGLPEGLGEGDLVFHAVKRLFAEALEQLPQKVFLEGEDGTRTADSRRKQDVSRAEQRVIEFLRLGNFTAHREPERAPQLTLRRSYAPQGNDDMEIEVQCHQAQCSNLRDALIAEDVRLENMACISPDEQAPQNTCLARRYTRWEGDHHQTGLEGGKEYFFVVATPSDPHSIVRISSTLTTATRPPAVPSPSPAPLPPAPLDCDESVASANPRQRLDRSSPPLADVDDDTDTTTPAHGTDDTLDDGAIPDAGLERKAANGDQPPTPAPVTNGRSAGTSRTPAKAATQPGLFAPGSPLRNLDIFDIERDGWYQAKNSDNVRAVLGILRGQQYARPGESRKRRRTSNS